MTVLDNVLVGAQARSGDVEAEAHDALDYVGLGPIAGRPVAGLPFGTLKRVEASPARSSRRRLLLLDEPAGGGSTTRRSRARPLHPEDPRRPRADRAARRAPARPRDGDLRPRARDELRQEDRRGTPAEVGEPGRDRGAYLGTDEAAHGAASAARRRTLRPRARAPRVSLAVEQGQIVAVLGANGAGKTTTLRSISGTVKRHGQILFDGKPLGRRGPEAVARLRRRARARGGPRHLRRDVGREPQARRLRPPRLDRRRHRPRRRVLPGSPRASTSTRAPSPAASSRCSRSPAR